MNTYYCNVTRSYIILGFTCLKNIDDLEREIVKTKLFHHNIIINSCDWYDIFTNMNGHHNEYAIISLKNLNRASLYPAINNKIIVMYLSILVINDKTTELILFERYKHAPTPLESYHSFIHSDLHKTILNYVEDMASEHNSETL
jgi:hypothetical protein